MPNPNVDPFIVDTLWRWPFLKCYSKWNDNDSIYGFNDQLIDLEICNPEEDSFVACQQREFERRGFHYENLDDIRIFEETYAAQQPWTSYDNANAFVKSLYDIAPERTAVFRSSTCLGFCRQPKYLLYSRDRNTNDLRDLRSCSSLILEYLANLVDLFVIFSNFHFRLCFLNIALVGMLYFKLPADTARAEITRARKEQKEWTANVYDKMISNFAYAKAKKD